MKSVTQLGASLKAVEVHTACKAAFLHAGSKAPENSPSSRPVTTMCTCSSSAAVRSNADQMRLMDGSFSAENREEKKSELIRRKTETCPRSRSGLEAVREGVRVKTKGRYHDFVLVGHLAEVEVDNLRRFARVCDNKFCPVYSASNRWTAQPSIGMCF